MKKGWESRPLAEVCAVFADGDWVESKDQSPAGIRLIQTGNIGDGDFKSRDGKARYVSEKTFARLKCTEIFPGDCLISRLPDPVGRSCILPETGERMITAVDCTVVRFAASAMLPSFFNYYAQSREYLRAVDAETTGTTRNRISRTKLGQVRIPVPPLPEQHRVVEILDDAFEGIAVAKGNTERNLLASLTVVQSRLEQLFGERTIAWAGDSLDSLADSTLVGVVRNARQQGSSKPVAYIKMNNITPRNRLDTTTITRVDVSDKELATYGLMDGDFLFNTRNSHALVGKSCLYRNFGEDTVVFNNNIMRIRWRHQILPTFAAYAFSSKSVVQQIKSMVSGTTNVAGIYYKSLKNLWLEFPQDTAVQRHIVEVLDACDECVDALSEVFQRKVATLDELKASLLHQAFTGQL